MSPKEILEKYKNGEIDLATTLESLPLKGIEEMGFAMLDTDRIRRTGIPEVIYAAGKTTEQVRLIAERMFQKGMDILATRVTPEMARAIKSVIPEAEYHPLAQAVVYQKDQPEVSAGYIAIVAAGTSDIPVAEEAAVTAVFLGNQIRKFFDVGVAGIHRLFNKLEAIRQARVIIVIAGMEGALPSVVGGLVNKPVIGVPTSVGYGANFGGLSALLAMLNSCANGISVVNIDNGFGAACQASLINNPDCR